MSTDPFDKAKSSLGEAWKTAKTVATDMKKEIEKAGIPKTIDDAGREIARAATSVATHLGQELEGLGKGLRERAENVAAVNEAEHLDGTPDQGPPVATRPHSDSYPPPPPPTGGFAPPADPGKTPPGGAPGPRVRIADGDKRS
jgi:hypothetical protein